jgi:hypothetical protein
MRYDANMRRTTIFLPEELHERLRREAFRDRVSMASLIRSRLEGRTTAAKGRKPKLDPILAVAGICHGTGSLASEDIDKDLYGI